MSQWRWIETPLVLAIDERLLASFGGAPGLRDVNLLEAALARPKHVEAFEAEASIFALSAFLSEALVRNHPFVDGNKRVAFVAGVLLLETNGYRFSAAQDEAAAMMLALADKAIDARLYAEFLSRNSSPA